MTDEPLRPGRPIVLVGPMGAGKTSVGRLLAARLALPFFDTDEAVERETGRSIAELFAGRGEPGFRRLEAETIARLVAGRPAVIASGGGAFADAGTRALVLERCTAVWLKAGPETLARRLADVSDRPLLRQGDPEAVLRRLAEARAAAYAEAQVHIDTDGASPAEVAERLAEALSRAPCRPPAAPRDREADCRE